MTNLDSILKSKDITLPTKVHLVKAMVFPVVMYGCESWIVKAERQRSDAFELWCWRRLLRVPWTARRSNQSILKISPGGMIWENGIVTCIYHVRIESPVYVRRRIQHAWGWCTVMTQRDVMGREVGGGFRSGNLCTPMADSC